mgnify:CR=1 FL=1
MFEMIEKINSVVNNFVWGVPAMVCIIGVGLYLSFRTRFIQIRKLGYSFKETIGKIFHSAANGCNQTKRIISRRCMCYNALITVSAYQLSIGN